MDTVDTGLVGDTVDTVNTEYTGDTVDTVDTVDTDWEPGASVDSWEGDASGDTESLRQISKLSVRAELGLLDINLRNAYLIEHNYGLAIKNISTLGTEADVAKTVTSVQIPEEILNQVDTYDEMLKTLTLFNVTVSEYEHVFTNEMRDKMNNSGIKDILSILNFNNSNNLYAIMNPQLIDDEDEADDEDEDEADEDEADEDEADEDEADEDEDEDEADEDEADEADEAENETMIEDEDESNRNVLQERDYMTEINILLELLESGSNIYDKFNNLNKLFRVLNIFKYDENYENYDPKYVYRERFFLDNFYLGYLYLYDEIFAFLNMDIHRDKFDKNIDWLQKFLYGDVIIDESVLAFLLQKKLTPLAATRAAGVNVDEPSTPTSVTGLSLSPIAAAPAAARSSNNWWVDSLNSDRTQPVTQSDAQSVRKRKYFGGQTGGACGAIFYDKLLLAIKLLYELMHDLGPHSSRAQAAVSSDPNFFATNTSGVFQQILDIWNLMVTKHQQLAGVRDTVNNVDEKIFNNLLHETKKTEDGYMHSVISALIEDCSDISDNFFYMPLRLYIFKSNEPQKYSDFIQKIQQYFPNSIMFVKASDTKEDIHLYITNDTISDIGKYGDSNIGFTMQDMGMDDLLKGIAFNKRSFYELYKTLLPAAGAAAAPNNLDMFFSGPAYSAGINALLNNVSSATIDATDAIDGGVEIFTPSRLIDPINSARFNTPADFKTLLPDGSGRITTLHLGYPDAITDQSIAIITAMNRAVYDATLYGINQLVNFWMTDDSPKITAYRFTPEYNGIIFSGINSAGALQDVFQINIRDTTVDSICKLLIKINNNTALTPDDQRLLVAAAFIMAQPSFILKGELSDVKKVKSIQMTIISFFKFCGDEFQRLTCDYLNRNAATATLFGNNIFFITKDRVLIGKSLENNTPIFANIQSPHKSFYEYPLDISIPSITSVNTGILSNRKQIINTPEPILSQLQKTLNKIQEIIGNIGAKSGISDITTIFDAFIVQTITETRAKINDPNAAKLDETDLSVANGELKIITDLNTKYPEYNFTKVEEVEILLDKLKIQLQYLMKLLLSLEYYASGASGASNTDFILSFINYEISKAVSDTFDTTTIDNLKISSQVKQFNSVATLKAAINSNIGEDSMIIKLFSVHQKAGEYIIQKLNSHIISLTQIPTDYLDSFRLGNIDDIERLYKQYIDIIKKNNESYINDFVSEIQEHISKARPSRGTHTSYADTSSLDEKIAALQDEAAQAKTKEEAAEAAQAAAEATGTGTKKSKTSVFKKQINELKTKYNKLTLQLELFLKKKTAKVKVTSLESYTTCLTKLQSVFKFKGGNKKTRTNRKNKHKNNTKNKNKVKKNKASKMNTHRQPKRKICMLTKKRCNRQGNKTR